MTPIEKALLDAPATQRMRYVGQSGLAHLVFPDLRTSRFIHSLGAMHLASRFFAASLERSEPDDRFAALRAIRDAVSDEAPFNDSEDFERDMQEEGLLAHRAVPPEFRAHVMVAEQGLRLAALFHDLGHLPFSHDFEYALEQLAAEIPDDRGQEVGSLLKQRAGRDALHERIGHDLTYLMMQKALREDGREVTGVAFSVARRILESAEAQTIDKLRGAGGVQTPVEGAWAWLHTLIAGELDVDRCDYILRDARNYGFQSARFDLQRLIDNFIVVRDPVAENVLVPAVRAQGQAAVEAFLIARARVYQWGTRQHKVGQVAAALRYAIGELLRPPLIDPELDHPLRQFLKDLEDILLSKERRSTRKRDETEKLLKRFAGYDDVWWTSLLRDTHEDDEWFKLVCWRTPGPRCLWKRVVRFPRPVGT